jgi:diguanylate cyclase (GGDEF)-like protein
VHQLLRGPFGRLGEAIPEARYEVIQALLRTSVCTTAALLIGTVRVTSEATQAVLVNLAIAAVSLAAAVGLARVSDPRRARAYGRLSTCCDVVAFAGYAFVFHEHAGVGGVYAVYVLLAGPLRYGLWGVPATVVPVGIISVLLPQTDELGGHIGPLQAVLLCIGFSVPAIAVRALLSRGSGRLRQAEQMLLHQAAHDPLTDLPNRHHALTQLEQALADGEQVAVLFLDLDRFKVVNDGMGHAEGDLILRQVAARLREVMRGGDLVARLGGDEFVVLCRDADAEAAENVAGRVLGALTAPMATSGGLQLAIGASIGIAIGTEGDVGDLVLADADTAMYAAKAAGGGRSRLFTADLRQALVRSHELELDLRQAVRGGRLSLVYQPMIDLASGTVIACEALCRWRDERWGVVGPDEFIAVAEQSDLILELGDWVLRRALQDAAAWPVTSGGLPPAVSVNVSLRQVAAAGFADRVAATLADLDFPATRLCLEVTETVLVGDVEPVIDVLHELRALGVQLSIDDFGTGHASLTYLARFPVDQVKVDRTFVAGLGVDAGSAAIVGGVVAMSRTFDLRVTAEGVETEQQLRMLRDLRCDVVQGFLMSVPVAQEDLLVLLSASTRHLRIPTPRTEPGIEERPLPADRERLLLEGAKQVTAQSDLDCILQAASDALRRCISFRGLAVMLLRDGSLGLAGCHPPAPADAYTVRIPLGQGVTGAIALLGQPRYLPDITVASSITPSRRQHALPDVRSWYGVPLFVDGAAVGVLQLDHTEVDAFDEEDRLTLLGFAPVVAQAIERAGLVADRRRVESSA